MSNILRSFSSLYFATLLMVLASGVLTTYLGLRLAADSAAQIWIGGMMSAYYLGLVAGSKVGHRLIARVGHIRAFVASAGITTASALGHALIDDLAIWLVLRLTFRFWASTLVEGSLLPASSLPFLISCETADTDPLLRCLFQSAPY